MTTPGGVPNLPQGALTIDTLASKTQDMTTPAMRSRAAERFPNIFDSSTGGNALNDLTPIGIITQIFSGFNSVVANADPADVQGPEDLPGMLLDFIESLPVVGELIGLLEAIMGTYSGDDPVLLQVQAIFAPIRAIVDALTAVAGGTGGLGNFFPDLLGLLGNPTGLGSGTVGLGSLGSIPLLGPVLGLFGGATNATQANNFFGSLLGLLGNPTGMTSGSPTLGSLGSIPILGPILGLFGGATTSTQANNFVTSLLSLIGNPSGMTSGSPTVPALSSIPLLSPVLGLFGGATTGTQASNFFTNLLSLLGTPTLTGATGSFNTTTAATNFINTVLNPTGLLTSLTGVADILFKAITGFARDGSGDPVSDLTNAFTHMPFQNVLGVGGPGNIGGSVQSGWDQLISGLVGVLGSGAGLADLYNVSQQVSSNATLGGFAFDIAGIRNNKSLNTGFLPTTQSNIGFDKVALQASAPTFALTQSTAVMAYHRISEASNFGVVSWHGSGVTSITDAYVNIFKMDTTTGDNTLVHASANIIGNLSGTMQQNVYSLPTPIAVAPGDVYGIELAIRGAGTHSVVGASTWIPDQTVFPRRFSSVRNSGTTAPPSTLTPSYGTNVPFIEFGVSASTIPIPHSPVIVQFATPGTTSYPIPSFANFVDRVVLGGSGGGHQGGTWGIGGAGGDKATWTSDTLVRGTDFSGSPSLTTVVGAAGTAGVGGNGGNGGLSSTAISGLHTISSTGGLGATSFDVVGSDHVGKSPGDYTFPGGGQPWVIAGGAAQSSYGADGNPSGGGGAGGNWVSFQPGGKGAPGVILYRFRQS